MSILPIFLYGSDVLHQEALPVESLDNETIKLIYDMMETMHKANGIGLAANQVGELKRVITIDATNAVEGEGDHEGKSSPNKETERRPGL